MKGLVKRFISGMLLVVLFMVSPVRIFAETSPQELSNEYGKAMLYADGKLIVSECGTGANESSYPWYEHKDSIKTLEFESTLTAIGKDAFNGYDDLTGNLVIPDSVTSIGERAFQSCGFNGTLTLGTGLTTIESSVFRNCGFTGNLIIPDNITFIGDYAFANSKFTGNLIVPDTVISVGNYVFSDSTFDGALTLGTGLTSIGNYAFQNCSGFTGDLIIPDNVTSIGKSAFYNCGFDGNLVISNNVKQMNGSLFENCGFTGTLILGNQLTNIGSCAFKNCGFTGDLVIPDSVTTIGDEAFYNCTGFNGTLTLGNSLKIIRYASFYNCTGFIGDLIIPDSVTEIQEQAFVNSGFTGALKLGNNLEKIGGSAFYECAGFTGNLIIPDSVIEIGVLAFYNCSGFNGTLTLGNNLNSIEMSVFESCDSFTGNLEIPDNVTYIEGGAFKGCSSFNGMLKLGSKLEYIGMNAFEGCSGFKGDLVIPDSVTSIGGSAFEGCSSFNGILTLGTGLTTIGDRAFKNCSGFVGSLILPESVKVINEETFYNCSSLGSKLVLHENLIHISPAAFSGMSGITEIEKPKTLVLDAITVDPIYDYYDGDGSIFGGVNKIHTIPTGFTDEEIDKYLYNQYRYSYLLKYNTNSTEVIDDEYFFKGDTFVVNKIAGNKSATEKFSHWTYESLIGETKLLSDLGEDEFKQIAITRGHLLLNAVYKNGHEVKFKNEENLIDEQIIFDDENVSVPNEPIKEYHRFLYWEDESGNTYSNDEIKSLTVSEDMVFHAVFEEIPVYTVSFETYADFEFASQSIRENEFLTEFAIPERAGSKALYWTDESGNKLDNIFEIPITSDRTFYLMCEHDAVIVDSITGSEISTVKVKTNEKLVKADLSEPVKDNHNFIGWFSDKKLTTEFDFGKGITERVYVYAGFEKIEQEQEPDPVIPDDSDEEPDEDEEDTEPEDSEEIPDEDNELEIPDDGEVEPDIEEIPDNSEEDTEPEDGEEIPDEDNEPEIPEDDTEPDSEETPDDSEEELPEDDAEPDSEDEVPEDNTEPDDSEDEVPEDNTEPDDSEDEVPEDDTEPDDSDETPEDIEDTDPEMPDDNISFADKFRDAMEKFFIGVKRVVTALLISLAAILGILGILLLMLYKNRKALVLNNHTMDEYSEEVYNVVEKTRVTTEEGTMFSSLMNELLGKNEINTYQVIVSAQTVTDEASNQYGLQLTKAFNRKHNGETVIVKFENSDLEIPLTIYSEEEMYKFSRE